ncbi:AzlC family ABC transporter permease [Nitratireductor sp. ZSWI3]|uniref:AzlC family ABC transporter permease n=1 Tax=Nitratireductor sp. ZSWI3 TaxID=2966359 RepID=UPI00214FB8CE|nr:AzlC family ABC transporter permease [Nitratireductor sp. ZSWI3]MCR4269108.1 AzlC family ABC transporter permease [Nitratireductor sp. ZSWI3]
MTTDILTERSGPRDFAQGFKDSLPIVIAAAPFGVLFGALAVDNGFTVFEAVLMSATIFAGASQMVGIDLFGQKVAPWLIVLSIFAVNFRHVLYSATTGRRIAHWNPLQRLFGFFMLVDPIFAEAERRGERIGTVTFGWYAGAALPVYVFWVVEGWIGALFGKVMPEPEPLGIDFLLPIYFLGLVMGFRKRPFWLPVVAVSALASIIAYRTIGSPWHVSIGAAAGVLLAAAFAPAARQEGADR